MTNLKRYLRTVHQLPLGAGHRDGSFIRMKRIERIDRIAPSGDTASNTWAGISCLQPLGMHQSPIGAVLRNNKKTKCLDRRSAQCAKEIDPGDPLNPSHPDETSVSVARINETAN